MKLPVTPIRDTRAAFKASDTALLFHAWTLMPDVTLLTLIRAVCNEEQCNDEELRGKLLDFIASHTGRPHD